MTTQPLVFIDGDQGTTGLQIHQRLHDRTDLQLLTLPESDRKNPTRRAEAINSCDIAILCLPKFCTLRHISAENTGVSVNLPILFHRPPFCLLHGGCFYRCCSIVQSS